MIEMVIIVEIFIMLEMVIMVKMVTKVQIVLHRHQGHHGHQGRQERQYIQSLAFKVDFPGNLWRAAFAILVMFLLLIGSSQLQMPAPDRHLAEID